LAGIFGKIYVGVIDYHADIGSFWAVVSGSWSLVLAKRWWFCYI